MPDWKSALSALAGETLQEERSESKEVAQKKRTGVVYSTNPDFEYEDDSTEEVATLPKQQQKLRLSMERAGRGGKTVTIIRGFVGRMEDMEALCKLLKQKCGVGGAVKDGDIILQGDYRARIIELLKKEGYNQTK